MEQVSHCAGALEAATGVREETLVGKATRRVALVPGKGMLANGAYLSEGSGEDKQRIHPHADWEDEAAVHSGLSTA